MSSKAIVLILMVTSVLLVGGYVINRSRTGTEIRNETTVDLKDSTQVAGNCQEEEIAIEGYGEKGKRLKNCFVEYSGEPTRQDKSYYVLEDVCGQFTKEFVENALGKPVIRIEKPTVDGLFNCKYIFNDRDDYVMLVFEYLSVENQKKGQEMMGRRIEVSDQIPMRNMVVWQPDGLLNTIYLVLGDEKFLSIERTSTSGLTSEELIRFAGNIAGEIKEYK